MYGHYWLFIDWIKIYKQIGFYVVNARRMFFSRTLHIFVSKPYM